MYAHCLKSVFDGLVLSQISNMPLYNGFDLIIQNGVRIATMNEIVLATKKENPTKNILLIAVKSTTIFKIK